MSRWLEYASPFEEGIHNTYFDVRSAHQAFSTLENLLKEKAGQIIFLLGRPGTGKTHLLNHLKSEAQLEHTPILFETPVINPQSFLKRIIQHKGHEAFGDEIEALKIQAEELYRNEKTLILLDEAQLLNDEMLEFIRILCDTRLFWIVCAMHKDEGDEILKKSHFKSRPYKRIELGQLTRNESDLYLNTQLILTHDKHTIDFHQRHAKKIYNLTQGNFRYLKKLIYTEFSLLHEAHESGSKKFQEPSKCLLNMAAIEIGLINV